MGAVEVVVREALVEVALEAGEPGHERSGEGRPPSLLEDRQLQALDAAIRVRVAGLDEALARPQVRDSIAEALRADSDLLSVVTSRSF